VKVLSCKGGVYMTEKILQSSFDFSIRLIELVKYLKDESREFPLSERLLICGNGIGVNLSVAKMSAAKERAAKLGQALACAVECGHLLKLMAKTGDMTEQQSVPLREDCSYLINMIDGVKNKKNAP